MNRGLSRWGLILLILVMGLHSAHCVRAEKSRVQISLMAFTVDARGNQFKQKAETGQLTAEYVLNEISRKTGVSGFSKSENLENALKNYGADIFYVPNAQTYFETFVSMEMVTDVQYFTRKKDGSFALNQIPWDESAGFWVDCTAAISETPNLLILEYSMIIRVINARESLPGVDMDIGKPRFAEYHSEDRLEVPAGEWVLLDALEITEAKTGQSDILMIMTQLNPLNSD